MNTLELARLQRAGAVHDAREGVLLITHDDSLLGACDRKLRLPQA